MCMLERAKCTENAYLSPIIFIVNFKSSIADEYLTFNSKWIIIDGGLFKISSRAHTNEWSIDNGKDLGNVMNVRNISGSCS